MHMAQIICEFYEFWSILYVVCTKLIIIMYLKLPFEITYLLMQLGVLYGQDIWNPNLKFLLFFNESIFIWWNQIIKEKNLFSSLSSKRMKWKFLSVSFYFHIHFIHSLFYSIILLRRGPKTYSLRPTQDNHILKSIFNHSTKLKLILV